MEQPALPRTMVEGFVHFDATEVRRAKMRAAAMQKRAPDASPATPEDASPPTARPPSTAQETRAETISIRPLISVELVPSD